MRYDMMWYDMICYAIHLLHHYTLQYLHGVYSACAILYYIPTTVLLPPTTPSPYLSIYARACKRERDGWMDGWMDGMKERRE